MTEIIADSPRPAYMIVRYGRSGGWRKLALNVVIAHASAKIDTGYAPQLGLRDQQDTRFLEEQDKELFTITQYT